MANRHPKYWCRSHLYSGRRSSQPSLQALDARADKHSIRRDKILMCAIFRVWLAHVRGREVIRQRDQKLLYSRFLAWKKKVARNRQREGNLQHIAPESNFQLICTWELAAVFYQKTSIRVISTTLLRWQEAHISHRNAYEAASRFYDECLVKKMGLLWLSRLRESVEERKRQKLVKKLQNRQAARVLYRRTCFSSLLFRLRWSQVGCCSHARDGVASKLNYSYKEDYARWALNRIVCLSTHFICILAIWAKRAVALDSKGDF